MKLEAFLLALALALSFLSGLLIFSVRQNPSRGYSAPVLQTELQKFESEVASEESFLLQSYAAFINPANLFPSFYRFDFSEVQALHHFSKTCKNVWTKTSEGLQKAWDWQKQICEGKKIPDEFATSPPYFHPSGHTYAYLMKRDEQWNQEHQKYFHLLELERLKIGSLGAPLGYLVGLDWQVLDELAHGNPLILSKKWVFFKTNEEDPIYKIYALEKWNQYWIHTPFHAKTATAEDLCFVKQGPICWSYDLKQAFAYGWNPLLALWVLSLILTTFLSWNLIRRTQKRQKEKERMKFALEMLTHELRTPLTNLSLNIEQLRTDFDLLPQSSQSVSLRIFDQLERLRKVTESSQHYLAKSLDVALLAPELIEVSSLTAFIEYTLEPYLSQIEFSIEDDRTPVRLDPYWTSICIKNLVENALKHGEKPVQVSIRKTSAVWSIQVTDQGKGSFNPEKKGAQSTGMGLGLKLIRRILPSLKARMTITYKPTEVCIYFGESL